MNILAIETATEVASVALACGGQTRQKIIQGGLARAEGVLALIAPLLAEADVPLAALDVIAFGRGPGSFTGLRVAASLAQGLAFALDRPVAAVSSLQALAHTAGGGRVLAALDARQEEVYYGYFTQDAAGIPQPQGEEGLCGPQHMPPPPTPHHVAVGSGADRYGEILIVRFGVTVRAGLAPTAAAVASLAARMAACGKLIAPQEALPVYLRDEVAKRPPKSLE
ncbi:MAG: tRNA (adenosine(37)-N6)-threonylcarbamoyltransferase complex dimerization subunit type 1 TsaB [Gammaproteobacteria bacterium]|nr:tRNA (adenosine(37)-N6)-threonylcarbamoyltransferase complex dimerization subunit type 1 TsaB [Gammaproteobacteria bacterium]